MMLLSFFLLVWIVGAGAGGRAQHGGRLRQSHLPGWEHRHHQLRHRRLLRRGGKLKLCVSLIPQKRKEHGDNTAGWYMVAGRPMQTGHCERVHGPNLQHVWSTRHRRRWLLPAGVWFRGVTRAEVFSVLLRHEPRAQSLAITWPKRYLLLPKRNLWYTSTVTRDLVLYMSVDIATSQGNAMELAIIHNII